MASLSKTSQDHDEIKNWAEERGGKPSHVKSTESKEDIGILRIDFPGFSGQGSLEEITWDQFFEKFDERNLALIFQEKTAAGAKSNFNKIVSAETAAENEERSGGRKGAKKSARGRKTAPKKAAPKKAIAKRTAAKKAVTKKSVAKKASPKKVAAKKAVAKKTAAKKTASKKAAPKKATAKKTLAKKAAGKRR